jgi:hypothetical protein
MEDKEIINEIKQDFKMQEAKHKQIEEMAYIIENAFKVYFGANDLVDPEDFPYQAKDLAKELLEHYQVVDKDSVVLSMEEYEILTKDIEKPTDEVLKRLIVGKNLLIDKAVKKTIDETIKETTEKLVAKIKQFLSNVETVVEDDKYSLYPEVGYKCSEVDDFIDELANNSMLVED